LPTVGLDLGQAPPVSQVGTLVSLPAAAVRLDRRRLGRRGRQAQELVQDGIGQGRRRGPEPRAAVVEQDDAGARLGQQHQPAAIGADGALVPHPAPALVAVHVEPQPIAAAPDPVAVRHHPLHLGDRLGSEDAAPPVGAGVEVHQPIVGHVDGSRDNRAGGIGAGVVGIAMPHPQLAVVVQAVRLGHRIGDGHRGIERRALHIQRIKDQLLHQLGVRPAGDDLQDQAGYPDAGVAVGIELARWRRERVARHLVAHVGRQPILSPVAKGRIGGRQAGAVAEEHPQRDALLGARLAEAQPGHVAAHRGVQVQLPPLHEAHDRRGGHGLGQGANAEQGAGRDRQPPVVRGGDAKTPGIDHLLALEQGQRHAGDSRLAHDVGNSLLEPVDVEYHRRLLSSSLSARASRARARRAPAWLPCARRP